MVKRVLCAALVVCMMICFAMPVFAETLVMTDVVADDKMPVGYISVDVAGRHVAGRSFVWIYSSNNDIYYFVSFTGKLTVTNRYDRFNFIFTNPDSLQIRAYPCLGRDVFVVTPDQTMTIEMPAEQFATILSGGTPAYVEG